MTKNTDQAKTNESLHGSGSTNSMQSQLDIQNSILRFAKQLLTLNSAEEIVWAITESVIKKLNYYDCVVYLLDEESQELVQRSAHGPKNPKPKEIKNQLSLKFGEGIVGHVGMTGVSEIIPDTRKDLRFIQEESEHGLSEIAVPILIGEKVIGVIDSEHPETNFFNLQHLEHLSTIASLSAVTLQNALNKEILEKQKENLEVEIAKRTEKLENTLKELKRSNEDLKNFAHVVSHDLKQPLRTINGFINLIKKKESNLSEQSKEYIALVSDGSLRMQDIVNGLLSFSKVANTEYSVTEVDLNEIVNATLGDLSLQIKESNAKINYKEMPVIVGFESLIKQVFQNLISNSIKFRQKDFEPKIEIEYDENPTHHIIHISDNGIGIPEDQKEKAFELFQRIHTGKQFEGTGMGLSFCRKIIERHDGAIEIESKGLNNGTTISFTISKSLA